MSTKRELFEEPRPRDGRELLVAALAAVLVTFTAWTWGGVVLWTQWVAAALGLLALATALFPVDSAPRSPLRPAALPLVLGLATAAALIGSDLALLLEQRDDLRLMLPGAEPPPLRFAQWGARGLLAGAFVALAALVIAGLARPSDARRRLLRFPPFWLGLFLFGWIACQSWNTWGIVDQGDLFWRILPRDHLAWLPSGLAAPFASDEPPGGMNGWRQLLILVGPWAALCALRCAVRHRASYAWLAAIAVANGLGVAIVGNLCRANRWESFLGFSHPEFDAYPFAPFLYRNHAGAFLCLAAALALALMFQLAKRRGDKADRGGPHLLLGLAALALAMGAASTFSFFSAGVAAALILAVMPAAYLADARLRAALSPAPALAMALLVGFVAYAGLESADARQWRHKLYAKQRMMNQTGGDDRAPFRQVVGMMLAEAPLSRVVSGYGAGSFRWTSPTHMAAHPEFLDRRGKLAYRATHAHNDWLQALVEWGLAGLVVVVGTAVFLFRRVRAQFVRPRAQAIALLAGILLFAAHAGVDFLLFPPHLVLLAVTAPWLMLLESPDNSPAR